MRTTLKVTGMTCNHCVHSVRSALEGVAGVRAARVELERGRAVVDYDEGRTGPHELAGAVADAGYQAEEAA
jgi:copper chaperone